LIKQKNSVLTRINQTAIFYLEFGFRQPIARFLSLKLMSSDSQLCKHTSVLTIEFILYYGNVLWASTFVQGVLVFIVAAWVGHLPEKGAPYCAYTN